MQVEPPINGKKLWRVKRSVLASSASSLELASSLECFNNSKKISAAGKQFMMRRPPTKRPKSKPGMPKDFVFVDLSPIKSDSDALAPVTEASAASSVLSPILAISPHLPFSNTHENASFSCPLDEELAQYAPSAPAVFDDALLGLGLLNVDYDFAPQPESYFASHADVSNMSAMRPDPLAYLPLAVSPEYPVYTHQTCYPNTPRPQPVAHKRTQSTLALPRRRLAAGFQFKLYAGPNGVKKAAVPKRTRRSLSQPTASLTAALKAVDHNMQPLAALLQSFDCDLLAFLPQNNDSSLWLEPMYTPPTDYLDCEHLDSLLEPISLDVFPGDNGKYRDEFDMSSFIAL